ncbi:MAG: porin [Burkholderiaceae bacterium]
MKNTYIALAIAAAMAPAAAMAASNVEMYGRADAYVGFADDDRAGGDGGLVVGSGGQSSSRWGVQGNEDLGGGLSAVFQFEAQLAVDEGTPGGLSFGRRSYVGLKGGFGSVLLGRTYTPLFWLFLGNDVSGMGGDVNDASLTQANRASNGIHYRGSFGAIKVDAMYAASESAADDAMGIAATYDSGAFRVGLGYHDLGGEQEMGFGGQVRFGGFRVGLNYLDTSLDNAADPDAVYGVSAGMKVGAAGDLILNMHDIGADTRFGIQYRHTMTKRTNWYAMYGDQDSGGTQFNVGILHKF